MARWRGATAADVPGIAAVAEVVHASFPERAEVFADRIAIAPAGCHVLVGDAGGVVGYILSHGWRRRNPPPLDTILTALPADADCWYIHDIALLPEARGGGAARVGVARAEAAARQAGLMLMALVAVGDAHAWWRRQGYRDVSVGPLGKYGAGAAYMEKPLGPE